MGTGKLLGATGPGARAEAAAATGRGRPSSRVNLTPSPRFTHHSRQGRSLPGNSYSQRNATIGSARIARRAGTQHASSAAAPSTGTTAAKVSGSVGLVS
jgi:hypothetical protein